MAMLKFLLFDLEENQIEIENVISIEMSKSTDAACDGLRITFLNDTPLAEINRVEAYDESGKIFNGYCDTQRETVNSDGIECFIYARSSACLLVDNEAKPFTYNSPSALSLFVKNAKEFEFSCKLPNLYCASSYQVSKGTSCYAAINDLVYGITGKNIIVTVENELTLPSENDFVNLNDYDIISEKRVINRGSVISAADYKNDSENDYSYHIKSRYFENKKIKHSKKYNLSSLPEWQKNYTLMNVLKAAAASYDCIEIVLDGCNNFSLYSNVLYESSYFGKAENYYISEVCLVTDRKGERTKLTISKNIDLKEITYVAK